MSDTSVQKGAVENWIRETWMPAHFGQQFTKGRRKLSAGGMFEFDGISADGSTVVCVSTSKKDTASGGGGRGKWFKLRSDMLYLLMAQDVTCRVLVLTEPCMLEHFLAERRRGRVPREIEVELAELPPDLRERLDASRKCASEEVTPG